MQEASSQAQIQEMFPATAMVNVDVVVMTLLCAASAGSITSNSCTNCDGKNVTCVDDVCLPRCVKVTSSGVCLQCRDSRFYGKQCQHDCPDTCLNSRCQVNNSRVVCTEGCVAGKKGDNCRVNCGNACTHCKRYGDGCTGPCQNPQYYGQHCRTSCPSMCTGGCNRITGDCDSCEPGYTGEYCDVTCPPNCRGGCDKDTGECDNCEPGYTGDKCDVACPPNCRDGCDKDTGKCASCKSGYTGDKCNVTCPPNCRDGCDRDTGKCDSCVEGYSGDHCDRCELGYTGYYCNITCPPNCRDCNRETGECIICVAGYCKGGCDEKGDNCNSTSCKTTCRANCKIYDFTRNQCSGPCINANYYGKICTTPCPDYCDKCEKDSARCLNCAPGLRGELCNESCPSNCKLCGRYDNICMGLCHDNNYHGANCSNPCPVGCEGCEKDTGLCIGCAQSFSRTYCDEMCSPCSENTCHRELCEKRSADHTLVISLGALAGLLCCTVLAMIILFRMYVKRRNTDNPIFSISRTTNNTSVTYSEIDDSSVSPSRPTRPPLPLKEIPKKRRAVFGASALTEMESVSSCESVQSECGAGVAVSEQTHHLTQKTDSVIFIEENCDLSV